MPKPNPFAALLDPATDLSKIDSPALRRLIEEVRREQAPKPGCYDRIHNRHNRS